MLVASVCSRHTALLPSGIVPHQDVSAAHRRCASQFLKGGRPKTLTKFSLRGKQGSISREKQAGGTIVGAWESELALECSIFCRQQLNAPGVVAHWSKAAGRGQQVGEGLGAAEGRSWFEHGCIPQGWGGRAGGAGWGAGPRALLLAIGAAELGVMSRAKKGKAMVLLCSPPYTEDFSTAQL